MESLLLSMKISNFYLALVFIFYFYSVFSLFSFLDTFLYKPNTFAFGCTVTSVGTLNIYIGLQLLSALEIINFLSD